MLTRPSCSSPASSTSWLSRSTRRCRVNAGALTSSSPASSPARFGPRRSRSTTPRRVGSASAANARSNPSLRMRLATGSHALHEPPHVPFEVVRGVAAVGPVIAAVVGRCRLVADHRTGLARRCAMGVGGVDVQAEVLREATTELLRARDLLAPRILLAGPRPRAGDHDQALAVFELAVLDAAARPLDDHANLEPERAAQPVDRGPRVGVEQGGGDARPTARRRLLRLHAVS